MCRPAAAPGAAGLPAGIAGRRARCPAGCRTSRADRSGFRVGCRAGRPGPRSAVRWWSWRRSLRVVGIAVVGVAVVGFGADLVAGPVVLVAADCRMATVDGPGGGA